MAIIQDNELKGRVSNSSRWVYRIFMIFLIIMIPFQLLPSLWMFLGSLKGPLEVIKLPPSLLPKEWLWDNFVNTFKKFDVLRSLKNTLILCFGTILIQVPISSCCAYALSKLKLKGAGFLLVFFVATMMISNQALVIPAYVMMTDFPVTHWNLIDTPWSLLLLFSAWGWMVYLFKNFFDSLPSALLEAARIDGAGNLMIFLRIIVPLSKPVYAIAILNTFNSVYNQFMVPLTMLPSRENWPLMVLIYQAASGSTPWNQVMVLLTVAALPMIIIYIFCQKYVVQGVVMSGIKG